MGDTTIEWATKTWNPLRGCSKVSEGCRNCYAVRQAHRFSGPGEAFAGLTRSTDQGPQWTGKVMLVPDKLAEPLSWRKPQRVFVNSMSDLFHEAVPDVFIDQVFGIMLANYALERQAEHSFMVLTKRPERIKEYFMPGSAQLLKRWSEALDGWVVMYDPDVLFSEYIDGFLDKEQFWPLPNVWLGVSVENQQAADDRIPLLLQTPAAVRFLSCEPLLGELNLAGALNDCKCGHCNFCSEVADHPTCGVDWVIVGGESGPGARPMHPEWARSLRDQCEAAGVPFFFKQRGDWAPAPAGLPLPRNIDNAGWFTPDGFAPHDVGAEYKGEVMLHRVGKAAAGRLLDGRTWDEFPEQDCLQ